MNQQEYFMQMQMLGQEAEKCEQQMQMIDQQSIELVAVRDSIVSIKESSGKEKETEILANLGKGIFVKADLKEKDLYVNIGKDVIVKKTPDETIKIIDEQTKRMAEGKMAMTERIQQLQIEMNNLLMKAQKEQGEHSHEHNHSGCGNEDCECEEPCEDCECEHEKKSKKK
jgi:prefoldin alpha subunit